MKLPMLGAATAMRIPAMVSVTINSISVKPLVILHISTNGNLQPTNGDMTGFFVQTNGINRQIKGDPFWGVLPGLMLRLYIALHE